MQPVHGGSLREVSRAYLHIGANKTGTSAIQQFLARHSRELQQNGYCYPVTGRVGDAHYGISRVLGFGAPAPASSGRVGLPRGMAAAWHRFARGEPVARMRRRLEREFESSGCRYLVISSEHFVRTGDVGGVAALLAGFEVRVVVYLRRHDHWLLSSYNQAVRSVREPRWELGADGYVRFRAAQLPGRGGYRLLLERWEAVFGREALLVRPYESEQNEGGVVADFLRTIGCMGLIDNACSEQHTVNVSLPPSTTWLLDAIKRSGISPRMRTSLETRLIDGARPGAARETLDFELRAELLRCNAGDYEYIARHYMGRQDGRLFCEPDVPEQSWPHPDLAGALGEFMAALDDKLDARETRRLGNRLRRAFALGRHTAPCESGRRAGEPSASGKAPRTWRELLERVPMRARTRALLAARTADLDAALPGIVETIRMIVAALDGEDAMHGAWRA